MNCEIITDCEYHWKGFGNGFGKWDSYCYLKIIRFGNKTTVILIDPGEDSGTSITNAAEHIFRLISKEYQIPRDSFWVHHYPSIAGLKIASTLDLIMHFRNGHAVSWKPLVISNFSKAASIPYQLHSELVVSNYPQWVATKHELHSELSSEERELAIKCCEVLSYKLNYEQY